MIKFVLPAYNEAENLGPLLEKIGQIMGHGAPGLKGLEYQIVVVNDGSRDRTGEVIKEAARKLPIDTVEHVQNLGLPRTMEDGLRRAVANTRPDDVIIAMDADNTHEPAHALAMYQLIQNGYDLAIASRYQKGAREVGVSFKRRFLSLGANLMLKFFFPITGVRDYTCGYRAFRAGLLERAFAVYGDKFVEATTFSATAEILLKLRLFKPKAGEVPMVLRYDQKKGTSKMKIGATIADYLRVMVRMWRFNFTFGRRSAAGLRNGPEPHSVAKSR